jgi:hypothetical protein
MQHTKFLNGCLYSERVGNKIRFFVIDEFIKAKLPVILRICLSSRKTQERLYLTFNSFTILTYAVNIENKFFYLPATFF